MRIAIGSTNPTKTNAVAAVTRLVFPHAEIVTLEVPSGIPDQPIGDIETRLGALNRARAALAATDADWGVGLEGGINQTELGTTTNAWCVIVDSAGRVGVGGSANMLLTENVTARVLGGSELGEAMDEYADMENVKRKMGAIGVLTGSLLDR